MSHFYLMPSWFFNYAIILEVVFGIVTLLVAFYSYKVYRLCRQRESKIFGAGFLLISLSYFLWALLNFFLLREFGSGISVLDIQGTTILSKIGIYLHIVFFIAGLIMLVYMSLNEKNIAVYILLFLMAFLTIFLSFNSSFSFYLIKVLLFFVLVIFYLNKYLYNKNMNTLIVFVALVFLLIANIELLFVSNSCIHFVGSHLLELCGFSLILASLIRVVNHGKKKKQA